MATYGTAQEARIGDRVTLYAEAELGRQPIGTVRSVFGAYVRVEWDDGAGTATSLATDFFPIVRKPKPAPVAPAERAERREEEPCPFT